MCPDRKEEVSAPLARSSSGSADPEARRSKRRPPIHVTLEIEGLSSEGAGVARHEGKVHFVPGAFPGERVEAEIVSARRRFDRARLVRVIDPSPDRRAPRCPHLDYCGGCSIQTLDYSAQLLAKSTHVRDCLERIGGCQVPELAPPIASPMRERYRNKMEFTFAVRAWEPEGPPETPLSPALGLHAPGRYDAVFDLEECILPGPRAVQALRIVRDFARRKGLSAYRSREDTGLLRHLIVREGQNTGDLLIALVTRDEDSRLLELGPELAKQIPGLTGLVLLVNRTRATIARGEVAAVLHGKPYFQEKLLDLEFELHALSFFQTNTLAAERLVQTLREMVHQLPGLSLLDLYCGAGTLGLALASRFERVLGVDQVEEAIEDAKRNAVRNGLTHVEYLAADVEEWIRAQENSFDTVVLDPPRAGLHPRALARLPELAPRWIVYVSCNPATLARDAAGLQQAGYLPEALQIIDQFPNTSHVESILLFRRSDEPARFFRNPEPHSA